MNFHQRNNNYSLSKIFLYTAGIIIITFIFSCSWFRDILFYIGSPLWSIKNNIVYFISNNIEVLKSKKNLSEENFQLKKEIELDARNSALFDVLKKENEDLKNILGRKSENQKVILAAVLVKPFLSAYDTIIIDLGSSDGISVGDQVLADGNSYIGYISEVYDNTSKVILYSSAGNKVKVLIGDNNIEKEAVGLGSGNFEVEMPKEIDVKEGSPVIIPSLSSNLFGVVEKIEFKDSDSFQKILFKNPMNISELKWVEVLLSNKKN